MIFTMKRLFLAVRLALLLALVPAALASAVGGEALDITQDCVFSTSHTRFKPSLMHDGKYTTKWESSKERTPYIQITMPAGVSCHGIYICFAEQPDTWLLQTNLSGEWITLTEVTNEYEHVYIPLYGADMLRIYVEDTGRYQDMAVNEVFLFSAGKIPDWVQRWQPTQEDADLMFLVAHPDDELLFFGGAVPTYAVEQQRRVVVVYMTYSNTTRRSELLNGLWAMGVRHYPVIGEFVDLYTKTSKDAEKYWGRQDASSFVVETIRKYKPKVLVTHDFDGEYGHGAHSYTAELALKAYSQAANAEKYPESAAQYGAWQVRKLYAHLYAENQITFDWTVPLRNMDGETGLALAAKAYALHITQQSTEFSVENTGSKYDNARFGLVISEVGKDGRGDDFLENVMEPVHYVPAEALPEQEVVASPEISYADILPALNSKGYVDEGEFVYINDESGLWIYISPALKVIIHRRVDMQAPLRWFEVEIWSDITAGERLNSIQYDADAIGRISVDAAEIALKHNVVFGMNTDYYTYRLGNSTQRKKGIVIRDGVILVDDPYTMETAMFPNLDTLALFDDGRLMVHTSYALTAREYLEMGATDVYSFGPYLINDGQINPAAESWGEWVNPRCAVGMIEPGHYAVVMAEGRLRNSEGITMTHLAAMMHGMGCQTALNMDGGQTAVLLFMGKQLNSIGEYDGNFNARKTTEILGIGTSDLVAQQSETEEQ